MFISGFCSGENTKRQNIRGTVDNGTVMYCANTYYDMDELSSFTINLIENKSNLKGGLTKSKG